MRKRFYIFLVSPDGKTKRRKQLRDPYIYHHKWLFVADDYAGFDVEASKQRSLTWMALEGIDKSRIGRNSYWEKHVIPRLKNADDCWYRSQDACKKLRVTSCELSHLRNAGKLPFRKVGNAFLYRIDGDESA